MRAANRIDMTDVFSSEEMKLRTPWSKSFQVSPYTHLRMSFGSQIHFLNPATELYDSIDNTLIPCEGGLRNKANGDMRMELLRNIISITHAKGYRLSWRIEGADQVEPKAVEYSEADRETAVRNAKEDLYGHLKEQHTTETQQKAREAMAEDLADELLRVGSRAVYPGIFPGTDLTCVLSGTSFKDQFVFETRESVRPVTFSFDCEGLYLKEDERGLSLVNEADETVYILPAPFCTESKAGKEQQPVRYTIQYGQEKEEETEEKETAEKAEEEKKAQEVEEEAKTANKHASFRLTYTLPDAWLETAVFPVTLDPAVVTYNAQCAIQDAWTCSREPDTVHPGSWSNIARLTRNSGNWGNCNCFYRFDNDQILPALDASDYIVYAQFQVTTAQSNYPTSSFDATAHEVTETWSPYSVTHNHMPSYAGKTLDYSHFTALEGGENGHTFDITNLVRKWYSGTNHGIMLQAQSNTYAQLRSSAQTPNGQYRPIVIIHYFSKAGVEDYLSYETQPLGRAGTGYVSLFNGNLIFEHSDTVTTGNILPVSVSHYYNSCYREMTGFGCGYGFKMSIQQALRKETISYIPYYTWVDADGAEIYFAQENGIWKDQTGREMTLTFENGAAVISDKQGGKRFFGIPTAEFDGNWANVKVLYRIENALGQHTDIQSDNPGHSLRVLSITDGAGRTTGTQWEGANITRLLPPGDAVGISLIYAGNHLYQIRYQDGATVQYDYDGETGRHLLTHILNVDGLWLHYTYTDTEPFRVTRAWINSIYDQSAVLYDHSYDYRDILTIVMDNLTGKKIRYHFNDSGNLISVSDELGYGAAASYSPAGPLNKPEALSRLQRSVINLLRDPTFRTNSVWIAGSAGGTGTLTYDMAEHYLSARSLRLDKTNDIGSCTAAQSVRLQGATNYTFSAFAKTAGSAAAQLYIHIFKPSGETIGVHTESLQLMEGWQRLVLNFYMPETDITGIVNAYLVAEQGPGTVWFDGPQLEESLTPGRVNLLSNGDFGGSGIDWYVPSGAGAGDAYAVSTLEDAETYPQGLGGYAYRMSGGGSGDSRRIAQEIGVSGRQNDAYVAGGWSAAHSVPRGGEDQRYCMELRFYNGSSWVSGGRVLWGEEWSGWKFAAKPILAPCDYTAVQVLLCYDDNYNSVAFGGLFVHREEFGQSFVYDSKGNVISTTDTASLKDYAEYDENYNYLTEYRQPGRPDTVKTVLWYGETDAEKRQRLVRRITSPTGIQTAYTYDENGNGNVTETDIHGNNLHIRTQTGYSADGNYAVSQTDARGKCAARTVDANLGTVTSETDPMGHTVYHTHDVMKRITKTEMTTDGNTYRTAYSYTNDRLMQVIRRTSPVDTDPVIYQFEYDLLGRPTVTRIGTGITLTTTAYNQDGTIQCVTYGNGGSVHYTYDSFLRLTGVSYDGSSTPRYVYTYGNNGEAAQIIDNGLGRFHRSDYDLAGRPCRRTMYMLNGYRLYEAQVSYDTYGNLERFRENVTGSGIFETAFTYDNENRPTQVSYGSNFGVNYTYDELGRIIRRTVSIPGNSVQTEYDYVPGINGGTTLLIGSIQQQNRTHIYSYDDNGNIISNTQTTRNVNYKYDGIGQLVRVNDMTDSAAGPDGTTWIMTYDLSGNILTKKGYPFTNDEVGASTESHTYTYGSTGWKDQLTAYDGIPISYDAIGNPLGDGTWEYTWEQGKQLRQMAKTDNTEIVTYAYNEEGIRVRKTAASTGTTDYYLHGKNIVHLVQGNNVLHFFYDAEGKPSVIVYNALPYLYLYNLQGDVIALVDATNTRVVEYTYDAWGKPTGKTGSMAGTLGTIQPFRYRGYVYDEETGDYYLRSRYYRPEWGRFISADTLIKNNLFCYCCNSASDLTDRDGHSSVSLFGNDNNLTKKGRLRKRLNDPMDNQEFSAIIQQMEYENWEYDKKGDKKGMRYGFVDCVSVYRYAMKWYYYNYSRITPIGVDSVKEIVKHCTYELSEIEKDRSNLQIGMALFSKDGDGKYQHMGYYLGNGKVLESNYIRDPETKEVTVYGVRIIRLSETSFTECAYLKGIDYSFIIEGGA